MIIGGIEYCKELPADLPIISGGIPLDLQEDGHYDGIMDGHNDDYFFTFTGIDVCKSSPKCWETLDYLEVGQCDCRIHCDRLFLAYELDLALRILLLIKLEANEVLFLGKDRSLLRAKAYNSLDHRCLMALRDYCSANEHLLRGYKLDPEISVFKDSAPDYTTLTSYDSETFMFTLNAFLDGLGTSNLQDQQYLDEVRNKIIETYKQRTVN